MILTAPFIYPIFRLEIKKRISDLAKLIGASAKPEDVHDLRDYID